MTSISPDHMLRIEEHLGTSVSSVKAGSLGTTGRKGAVGDQPVLRDTLGSGLLWLSSRAQIFPRCNKTQFPGCFLKDLLHPAELGPTSTKGPE